jgi:hypothetical protein
MERPKLQRNVVALGLVSLFTDLSSERIYPLLLLAAALLLLLRPAKYETIR